MKKGLSLFLSLLMVISIITSVPVIVSAANTGIEALSLELNDDETGYIIEECSTYASGTLEIPETYKGLPIVEIGSSAFSWCFQLYEVIIPETVKVIGSEAFCNSSVQELNVSANVEKIGYGISYESDIININVSDENQFYSDDLGVLYNKDKTELVNYPGGRQDITTYFIPDSVTSIAPWAFAGRNNLETVFVPDTVTEIGDYAFFASELVEIDVPKGIKEINHQVYSCCRNLKTVRIYNNIEVIGDRAFSGSGIESVTIPSSVHKIQWGAFDECVNLASVTISNGVQEISSSAFGSCSSLVQVEIPESVSSLDGTAFGGCNNLTDIFVADSNTDYVDIDGVLAQFYIQGQGKIIKYPEGKKETSYVVPSLINSIENYAFSNTVNLKKIDLSNVGSLGLSAFMNCQNLSEVIFGKKICNLYQGSFSDCPSLKSVTVPSNIEYIFSGYLGALGCLSDNTKVEGFTIYGVKNSAAHTYAINNGFTFIEIEEICEHTSTKWITDQEATVYKAGSKHKECTECGEVLKTATIPQLKCSKPVLKKVYNANSYVKVTWGAVKGADLYRVYRKTGTGEYEYIGSTTHTYFNDKEAGAGKTCRYIVKAKNEAGNSNASTSIAVKHIDEPTLKSIENSAYGVLVKWDKVTGAEKYSVYRKVSGGEYDYIGATDKAYYTDKTAESGTKYYYAIRGKRDTSISSQSASLSKYYLADPTLKSIENSAYGVLIKWGKVTGAEKYNVYRKVSGGEYKYIGATSNTYYTDKTAKSGTKYYYEVRAKKGETVSALSSAKSIYHLADTTLNTPSSTTKGIGLKWSQVEGAEGYMVYRRTADGSYKRIKTEKGVSNLSYRDTTAEKGTKYYYKVKAYKSKTYSAYSNTKSITDKY